MSLAEAACILKLLSFLAWYQCGFLELEFLLIWFHRKNTVFLHSHSKRDRMKQSISGPSLSPLSSVAICRHHRHHHSHRHHHHHHHSHSCYLPPSQSQLLSAGITVTAPLNLSRAHPSTPAPLHIQLCVLYLSVWWCTIQRKRKHFRWVWQSSEISLLTPCR